MIEWRGGLPWQRRRLAGEVSVRTATPARRRRSQGLWAWSAMLIVVCSLHVHAEVSSGAFDAANKLYEQGKFADAAAGYEKLLQSGQVSEAIYFNWGNALFKSGQIGRAIAAYEQAERIAPRAPDVRANLQFARNQVPGPTLLPDRRPPARRKIHLTTPTPPPPHRLPPPPPAPPPS